jgi:hypothetical protein
MLSSNSTLEELILWKNQLGVEGAGSIAVGLRDNGSIKRLIMRENSMGPAGIVCMSIVDGVWCMVYGEYGVWCMVYST